MSIAFGQPVLLTFRTFSDAAGTTPADPTTVAVDVQAPDGTETTFTWAGGQIVHASTGVFTYTITPTTAGHYAVHWYSTGTVTTTQDESFNVRAKYGGTFVPIEDLATYLNNPSLNTARALFILEKAQQLCETIVTPLPVGADSVILDVAERAYANPTNVHGSIALYAEGEGPFSDTTPGASGGGLWLTENNKQTLRQLAGRGGAFMIDSLPADYALSVPVWDTGATVIGDWDSPT